MIEWTSVYWPGIDFFPVMTDIFLLQGHDVFNGIGLHELEMEDNVVWILGKGG